MTLATYLRHRTLYECLAVVLLTLLFGVVSATSIIIEHIREGEPSRWQRAFSTELSATLTVILLVPPLVWFVNRLNLGWTNFRWRVLWHIPAFICFSLAHIGLFVSVRKILWPLANESYTFGPLFLGLLYEMRKGLLIYIGLVLTIQAYQFIIDRLQGEAGVLGSEHDDAQTYSRQFLVKMLNKQYLIKADNIQWIQSASNYVLLHCGDRSYPMRQTLSGLAAQLDPAQFVRVHRTAVVNISRVRSFQDSGDLKLDLLDGTSVPVSKSCLPTLKQALTSRPALVSQP